MEYSEQVGVNLQLPGRTGDRIILYSLISVIAMVFIRQSGKNLCYVFAQIREFSINYSPMRNKNNVIVVMMIL